MYSETRNALSVGAAKGPGCHSVYQGKRMTGAQAIIAALECEGVTHIFGYPGAQAIALYDALYHSPSITHVLARHEQAAVHEADGFARATGNVGVVLVTSGPGATNTVTGIANAYLDSIPLVVITGQVPTSVIGTDAFQESDTISITMPVVKHSFLAQNAADLPRIVRQAFHIALTGRPGPVLIDVPSNIAGEELVFEYPKTVNIPSYKPTYKGNSKQVKAAVELLKSAEKPVILAGGGVVTSGAEEELYQLSHALQAPVALTLMGKGAFPAADPLNLGAVGLHGSVRSNTALMESDVLLAVGTRLSDRVTGAMDAFAPHAKLIHIDIDPAEIGKLREANVPIVGDAQLVLASLVAQVNKHAGAGSPQTANWLQYLSGLQGFEGEGEGAAGAAGAAGAGAAGAACGTGDAGAGAAGAGAVDGLKSSEITPALCMRTLSRALEAQERAGKRTIVTTEVGQHQMWAAQYLARSGVRSFLSSGGLGTMGFGFPAALGAAIACPNAQVVCIAGDGSIQMNIQELATAKAYGTAVKVIVMDNSCLGMVHQWQQFFYDQRYSQTELHNNPNFVMLAQAYGWRAARVTSAGELEQAITEMLESPQPYLLDIAISSAQNVLPMVVPGGNLLQRVNPECGNTEKDSSPENSATGETSQQACNEKGEA